MSLNNRKYIIYYVPEVNGDKFNSELQTVVYKYGGCFISIVKWSVNSPRTLLFIIRTTW